jgi:predicted nuclease of predicted toxin-antitoxin system
VKFLIDAQLPKRLASWLTSEGYDAVHTFDLPKGNQTPDVEICTVADGESRIVITKDDDFIYSFLTRAHPERLLLVSTGNINNNDLLT